MPDPTGSSTLLDAAAPPWPDVHAAGRWLTGQVVRTPVVRATTLEAAAGVELWLKAENLQRSGSFKVRGAMLAIGRLIEAGGCAGVIAQSTGNHGLAVATVAGERGLPATIVLPADASPHKVRGIRAHGARLVFAGTTLAERLAAVDRLHRATGLPVVDAFDHPDVVAGQGTATAELLEQVDEAGGRLDAVVVPVGGGGGVAGACLAAHGTGVEVFGVEPAGCDGLRRSLLAGRRVTVDPAPTIADGLRPALVGQLPFELARRTVRGVVEVDDRAIGEALCLVLQHTGMVVEPSAAAALAGALRLADSGRAARIGVLLTGGNVDASVVAGLLARHGADPAGGQRGAGRTRLPGKAPA